MNFRDNEFFIKKVNEKDLFSVKSSLVNMLKRTNRAELESAIRYAEGNKAFNWEADDGYTSANKWNTLKEEYNFEKERLVQNFSKERYGKVLNLLEQIKK